MVIRDPRDNIRSILNRLKISGSLADIPAGERARLSRAWELIIDGRWLGLDGGNYIEMLAQRWNYIADLYLANPDGMILVKYEDFSMNKIGKLHELASALRSREKERRLGPRRRAVSTGGRQKRPLEGLLRTGEPLGDRDGSARTGCAGWGTRIPPSVRWEKTTARPARAASLRPPGAGPNP